MPDNSASATANATASDSALAIAAAIKNFHDVENKIRMCMAAPDARDHALARLAQFGDPATLLAQGSQH